MYAIIASGGKQYKVSEGETLKIEKLDNESDETIEFDKILMLKNDETVKIGTPYVEGAKVLGEIVEHGRGDKVRIVKFRRRKHYLKQAGHRQDFTAVKITGIKG
jgi:large subunit ribosomal protein L21